MNETVKHYSFVGEKKMVKLLLSILLVFVIIIQKRLCIANILNGMHAKDSFTVFAVPFEPNVYVKNGEVYDGIEYHLVKMIAKALNKEISFEIGNVTDLQNAIDSTK